MNNLNNEFTLNFLLNNSPEIKCTRRTRPGHLVKWDNAPSSSSKELTLGTVGRLCSPPPHCSNYQSFLISKDANLKNISLGTEQWISPASLGGLGTASQSTGRSWLLLQLTEVNLPCVLTNVERQNYIWTAAKNLYIYICIFVFTNCTYLHDLIRCWTVEIRTTQKGVHFELQCYLPVQTRTSQSPWKAKDSPRCGGHRPLLRPQTWNTQEKKDDLSRPAHVLSRDPVFRGLNSGSSGMLGKNSVNELCPSSWHPSSPEKNYRTEFRGTVVVVVIII